MAEKRGKESRIKGNSFGASGFTLGILSFLSLSYLGIVFVVVGFIFCFIQQKKKSTKLGKAGIIINVIGLILCILFIKFVFPILNNILKSQFPSA